MSRDKELYIIDATKNHGIYSGLSVNPELQKRYVAVIVLADRLINEKEMMDIECFDTKDEAREWFVNWKEKQ